MIRVGLSAECIVHSHSVLKVYSTLSCAYHRHPSPMRNARRPHSRFTLHGAVQLLHLWRPRRRGVASAPDPWAPRLALVHLHADTRTTQTHARHTTRTTAQRTRHAQHTRRGKRPRPPGAPADADPCDMQPAHTRTTQARTQRTTRGRAHHTAQHKRAANTATRARTRHAHEAEPAHT